MELWLCTYFVINPTVDVLLLVSSTHFNCVEQKLNNVSQICSISRRVCPNRYDHGYLNCTQ